MVRKLAAILAADVVGYSKLMGENESETLAALRQLRSALFGPAVSGHRGQVIKSMGDSWLVEFASAVDAVNCALQIQDRLAEHELIKLRIGIHIGDIVHEDEDIFGDGVNVAARLQETAAPGAVLISDATFGSLDGTLTPSFDDAGQQTLKNINRLLQTWVRAPRESHATARPQTPTATSATNTVTGFPILAIEPVKTSDERPELRELADALTYDLTTYLGASEWLHTKVTDAPDDQNYNVYASLRARNERLRLEIRLTSRAGDQLWTGKYDGTLDNSFDWQDKTGEDIAARILDHIENLEVRRLAAKLPEAMTAEECLIYGRFSSFVKHGAQAEVLDYLQLAMAKNPDFQPAYACAVGIIGIAVAGGFKDKVADYIPRAVEWEKKAVSLAGPGADLHSLSIFATVILNHDPTTRRYKIEQLLRQAPFDSAALTGCGWGYLYLGEPEPALDCFRKAKRFGENASEAADTGRAMAYVMAGKDQTAIEVARQAMAKLAANPTPYRVLAAALAHQGHREEAAEVIDELMRLLPRESVADFRDRIGFVDNPATQRLLDGLRLAGLPEQ